MLSTIGLVLIVATVLAFAVLLVDDGHRVLIGEITFSDWAEERPYRKYLFVAGAAMLPLGMTLHLFY